MRLEGFLDDFVSTIVNDNGRGDVETSCLVPYIPASAHAHTLDGGQDATKFYNKSYLAWLTYVDRLMSALSSSNSLSES
jgi:hypothetical protein